MKYLDRWGGVRVPDKNSKRKKRKGAFLICLSGDYVLVTYPEHAPDVPELPGGGIEKGESGKEAALRECYEETGVALPKGILLKKKYTHRVGFYAEDKDQYWDYHQKFYVIQKGAESCYFEGKKVTPEDGLSTWVPIKDLRNIPLHAIHVLALEALGFYNE